MKKGILLLSLMAFLAAPILAGTEYFDTVIDTAFDASDLNQVRIKARNVHVEGWDVDSVVVHAEYHVKKKGWFLSGSESYKIDFKKSGSTLRITEKRKSDGIFGIMLNRTERNEVRIQVPYNIAVNIQADDCSIHLLDLSGAVRVEFDDGALHAEKITGPEFQIHFSDGAAKLYQVSSALRVEFDDGRFQLRESELTELNLRFSDGRADIETGVVEEGAYRVRFNDGRLEWLFPAGTAADIKAEVSDGIIKADFPNLNKNSYRRRFNYSLNGGGPLVDIRADDASIYLEVLRGVKKRVD